MSIQAEHKKQNKNKNFLNIFVGLYICRYTEVICLNEND